MYQDWRTRLGSSVCSQKPTQLPHLLSGADGTERVNLSGHQWYIQVEAGGTEKRFLETFGSVVRWNGPFGVRLAFY